MKIVAKIVAAGLLLCALGTAAALLLPRKAHAQAFTYSTTRRTFKVGNLLIESTTPVDPATKIRSVVGPENTAPYAFFIADARTDLKPLNWEFVNPLAPNIVTADIKARWDARDPSARYQSGQQVTKNMAAYWEVFLNEATVEDLLQFDLLFITGHRDLRFSAAEREKLRKLVDAGGIIWIEDSGGLAIKQDGRFFLDLQFRRLTNGNGGPVINVPNHPLLISPYRLTYPEIANLGDKNYGGQYLSAFPINETGDPRNNSGAAPPEPDVLINIIGNSAAPKSNGVALPYIAAGIYGSGAVIASAADVGDDINNYAGGSLPANRGAFSGPNIQTAHAEDLKFLYNMVAWGSANNTERRNARRTASGFESVGAPLVNLFDFTSEGTPASSIVASRSAPLVFKTVLFVSGNGPTASGTGPVLRAYDTQPGRDMDGDGNPDDGLPDLALGAPYDEIWRVDLPGGTATGGTPVTPSAPTAVTLSEPGTGRAFDAVFVTLPDGRLTGYEAFTATNGRLNFAPRVLSGYPNASDLPGGAYTALPGRPGVAPSPVYFGGRMFVAQPDGRIRCVNAFTGVTLWHSLDATTLSSGSLNPLGSPTVGFTRFQALPSAAYSGGNTLDLMLYQPAQEPNTTGSGNTGRILPFFLGTRNEVIVTPADRMNLFYNTRIYAGPGQERYDVARPRGPPGGNDDPSFIVPRIRVFSKGEFNLSARANYEAGNESRLYEGQWQVSSASLGAAVGQIKIVPKPPNTSLPTTPIDPDQFIVAVDYDVLYQTNQYGKPGGLSGNGSRDTQNGGNGVLRTNGAFVAGMEAVALSPTDLLIYSAMESEGTTAPLGSIYATIEQPYAGGTKARWRFTLHGGQPAAGGGEDEAPIQNLLSFVGDYPNIQASPPASTGTPLTGLVPVGAPIVTNDNVTYVLASARQGSEFRSVLMAFRTNQETVLNVGPMTGAPQVFQVNALTGAQILIQPNQYTVDAARGKITITNYQPSAGGAGGGQGVASASQSFLVTVTTPPGQTSVNQIHAPLNSLFRDDFSPLLWYYVLPGEPQSSPTLSGDVIYFTVQTAPGGRTTHAVVGLDANPTATNPTVKRGQQVAEDFMNHLRWQQRLEGLDRSLITATGSPVGAQGVMAVNTDKGTFVFEDALTLIADGKRILEANADGSVVWSLDSTTRRTVAGGELPVYDANGNPVPTNPPGLPNQGRIVEERKPISRPSTVRRLGPGDMLIADTGNNRVVRVDRSGRVLWNLERVSDPFRILASGDPETLNSPMDVQVWTAINYDNSGTPTGYEVHYLIADAGNFRLIEVVDFFDQAGRIRVLDTPEGRERGQHVLVWTTRTGSREGRRLRYQSVQRFVGSDTVNGTLVNGVPIVVAVVGNMRAAGAATTASADFTGGALVGVNYRPYNPLNTAYPLVDNNGNRVDNFNPWPAERLAQEPPVNGLLGESVDDLVLLNPADATFRTLKRITRPLYFQQVTLAELPNSRLQGAPPVPGRRQVYLLADAEGVYEIEPRIVNINGQRRSVRYVTWSFTQNDYHRMNGVQINDDGTGTVLPGARLALPSGSLTAEQVRNLPRFVPASVRRLPSGNYLITNAFTGASSFFQNRQFLGEVFEVDPFRNGTTRIGSGGTFENLSIPRLFPVGPGLNQQQMGRGNAGNTNLLEQPLFADRL